MKNDFLEAQKQLKAVGIVTISADFYMRPKRVGSRYYVKSPASKDEHWSCCLYPQTGTFCDFANGDKGGDCIGFLAYVRGVTNWEALKLLRDFYGLLDSDKESREEIRRKIRSQQAEERRKKERQREFETALNACIRDLKHDTEIYRAAIGKGGFEPFSDEWCHCVDRLDQAVYRSDILCGIGTGYLRVKPDVGRGLPSDHPQWLLDTLEILGERGMFFPTDEEIKEIKAQRDFELTREPGRDRGFLLSEWWNRKVNGDGKGVRD